ncbi:hypothetical protein FIM08_00235 [SAR202 cluster bacterium AC-647-N09_OGT_505m]|nr:hypothetical protein [SAR202 cluster bacterium AC-647-N09_OGT_505m]
MNNKILAPILILALGLVVGFFLIYSSKSNEIQSLRATEVELSDTNRVMTAQLAEMQLKQDESDLLEAEISRLLLTSASGGGVNMKMMPHPETNELSVELPEVFSFDQNHAFCRVDTNREAFIMPTYQMGDVLIEKNEFYMSMSTTSMEEFKLSRGSDGKNQIVITGGLDCFTEVAKANMRIGSREVAEVATYKIEATDGGLGGGSAGDTFKFTTYFDPIDAPVNYAIFGPEFTFTGDMIDGEVTVPDPR